MTVTLHIPAGELRGALDRAKIATPRSPTGLACARITVGASGARLDAGDVRTHLDLDLPAVTHGEGACALPVRAVLPLLAVLPEDTALRLSWGDNGPVTLAAQGASLILPGAAEAEVPRAPAMAADAPLLGLGAGDLRTMIARTRRFMASEDETMRPTLAGLYLHRVGDMLRAVGTNGHVLMWQDALAPDGWPSGPGIILPARAVRLLAALLDDAEAGEMLVLRLRAEAAAAVEVASPEGGWTVTTGSVEGEYPRYESVLKPDLPRPTLLTVRQPASLAAWLAGLIGGARGSQDVTVSAANDGVQLITICPEDRRRDLLVPDAVATQSGPDIAGYGLRAAYLKDLCDAVPEGFALARPADSGPARLDGLRGADGAAGLIMPMQMP